MSEFSGERAATNPCPWALLSTARMVSDAGVKIIIVWRNFAILFQAGMCCNDQYRRWILSVRNRKTGGIMHNPLFRHLFRKIVLAACTLLLGGVIGQAATLYVGGTNTPNYATITLAIAAASAGDTIRIETNLVTEAGIIVTKANLTFIGLGRTNTIVQAHKDYDSANNLVFYINASSYPAATNATFCDMTIRHGKVAGSGGGISAYNASLVVSNCVVTRNRATGTGGGGGIYLYNPGGAVETFALFGSTISDNESGASGGGIFISQGSPTIRDSTISGNTAGGFGGGAYIYYAPSPLLVNCTIYGNKALTSDTTAGYGGGGIAAYANGTTTIRNCTIVSNAIPNAYGGGIGQHYSALNVESSIIAGNTALAGPDHRRFGSTGMTEKYNLVGTTNGSLFTAGLTNAFGSYVGTSAAPLDPKVSPLADNGGPAKTCALLPGSLAVNHGTNSLSLPYDQRGAPYERERNRVDIGAYEYGAGPITLSYSVGGFTEKLPASNGAINNAVPMLLTLDYDTFTGTDGNEITNNVVISNLPDGLTVSMIRANVGTNAIVTLTGSAVNHAPGDTIANLGFAFPNAAFTRNNAGNVINATRTDLSVTFNDPPVSSAGLEYLGTNFTEDATWNDGRIDNTFPVSIVLSNDAFNGSINEDFVFTGKAEFPNLPSGLTGVVTFVNSTNVTVTLTGRAAAHAAGNTATDRILVFKNEAFSGNNAAAVTGSSNASLRITFLDPAADVELLYGAGGFSESAAFNDGRIDNAAPLAIVLTNDVFQGTDNEDFVGSARVVVANLPNNLTAAVTRVNFKRLEVTLTGKASAHNATDNVNNLTLAFQNSAFYNTVAAAVTNSAKSNLTISYVNPVLTWSGSFTEKMPDNNGAVDPATVVTATLLGDTFTGVIGSDMTGKFSTDQIPSGLSVVVTNTSDTVATVRLTGNAVAHANANDASNLTVAFGDTAFSHGGAANVTGVSNGALAIDFKNPSATWYVSAAGTNGAPHDGSMALPWKTITYAMGVATNWDTIHVLGTLTESGIYISKSYLTFAGDGPGNTIVQAHADYDSAADRVFNSVAAGATFQNMTIRHGKPNGSGGGINSYDGSVAVSNCVVTRNRATGTSSSGGGIYVYNSGGALETLAISGSVISDNESGASGGGVGVSSVRTTFYDSTISGNTAGGWGGGAYIFYAPNPLLVNCTIYGNTALTSDKTTYGGGGVMSYANGTTTIRNCTIVSNSIPNACGGGIGQHYSVLDIASTIVAGNTAFQGPDHYWWGGSSSLTEHYNLVGNNTNSLFIAGTTNAFGSYVGTDVARIDPMLAPLADNGGPTKTCALRLGSLAINAGANPLNLASDQRGEGYVRVKFNQADIGAFEFGAEPISGTLILLR